MLLAPQLWHARQSAPRENCWNASTLLGGRQRRECFEFGWYDVHKAYFVQIQNDPWPTMLDLGAQVIEFLRSKFTAQANPRPPFSRKSFHFYVISSPFANRKGEAIRNGSSTSVLTKHHAKADLHGVQGYLASPSRLASTT